MNRGWGLSFDGGGDDGDAGVLRSCDVHARRLQPLRSHRDVRGVQLR